MILFEQRAHPLQGEDFPTAAQSSCSYGSSLE